MASAADTSSAINSPRSSRPARHLSSPWSHVVRGESDAVPAVPSPPSPPPPATLIIYPNPSDQSPPDSGPKVSSSSETQPPPLAPSSDSPDHGTDCNAGADRGKKPAWKMPSNGAIEVGPVMGAISWPALSESTKASPKSSSSDSLKALADVSASAPPGPVMSSPSSKASTNNTNPNPNPTPRPPPPARQQSMKRGSGSGTPANGGLAPPSPPSISTEMAPITVGRQTFPEPSPKGISNKNSNSNWDHGSKGGGSTPQSHSGSEHHRGYGGNRRGNNSSSGSGGGGSHHNSYGNRRDEWNHHRSFSGRDVHMQPQPRGVRPYPRPAMPVSPPFISPPPQVRLGNPMGYPDLPSPVYYFPHPPPESLRGMPFVAHPAPHALYFPTLDPQRAMLVKQIDYYFSNENLCKDIFLRQNMDDQGWVPITLIAGFNRVKQLTNNIQYILDTVRLSALVEVQDEKIRRRNDWMNWVLPPSNHIVSASGSQPSATPPDFDTLASRLQTVGLEGTAINHNSSNIRGPAHNMELVLTRSASGNLNNQLQMIGDRSRDGSGQQLPGYGGGSDRTKLARSLVRSDTL